MYPRSFRYLRASDTTEALSALADLGADARVLAGGASLIPWMKDRVVSPAVLIDIGGLAELATSHTHGGAVVLGAMVRHADVAEQPAAGRLGLLAEVAASIGDPQVRNMGTVGGGIAAVEPTGDWGPALLAARGSVTARRLDGQRHVAVDDLFAGTGTTLGPDELITEVRFPAAGPHTGWAHCKLQIRAGTAAGSAVAVLEFDGDRVVRAGVALGAIERGPVRVHAAEEALTGAVIDGDLLRQVETATRAAVDPHADVRGTADYRRQLAGTLVGRAVARAAQRAGRTAPTDPTDVSATAGTSGPPASTTTGGQV